MGTFNSPYARFIYPNLPQWPKKEDRRQHDHFRYLDLTMRKDIIMETKELWIRLGVTLQITAEEETAIFSCSDHHMADAVKKIIAAGRYRLNGDTYVPEPVVEEFNTQNGTAYEPGEYECTL